MDKDRILKDLAEWKKFSERYMNKTSNKRIAIYMEGKISGLNKAMEIVRRAYGSETNELEARED